MASLKAIRKRIASVKNTKKITAAMKLVAAARLRRAQDATFAARPYAQRLVDVIADIAAKGGAEGHPLLATREDKRRIALVVMTSDRGLCGGFNSNILRRTERFLIDNKERFPSVDLYVIGRKGREYFRRRPSIHVAREWPAVQTTAAAMALAKELSATLVASFLAGASDGPMYGGGHQGAYGSDAAHGDSAGHSDHAEYGEQGGHGDGEHGEAGGAASPALPAYDAVFLIYNEFKSAITQTTTVEPMLPVERTPLDPEEGLNDFKYEPSRDVLLSTIVPLHIETQIFRALLESVAGFFGAQMSAMDSATRNASEMIGTLTLQYNRVRQAAITKELMEIVGGAEALKG